MRRKQGHTELVELGSGLPGIEVQVTIPGTGHSSWVSPVAGAAPRSCLTLRGATRHAGLPRGQPAAKAARAVRGSLMAAGMGERKEDDRGDPGPGAEGTSIQEDKQLVVLSKHSGTLRKQQQSQVKRVANHLLQVREKERQGMGGVDRLS